MNIKDISEKWKLFQQRQKRIYERNLHSDEYHSIEFPTHAYSGAYELYKLRQDVVLQKDMHKDTFEGMLDWMNNGEKN